MDQRLVRFVMSVPQWRLHRAGENKPLVREAMRGLMPEAQRLTARPNPPAKLFDRGFREKGWDVVSALMTGSQAEALGCLQASKVLEQYTRYLNGKAPAFDFWWPVSLEMWLRRVNSERRTADTI